MSDVMRNAQVQGLPLGQLASVVKREPAPMIGQLGRWLATVVRVQPHLSWVERLWYRLTDNLAPTLTNEYASQTGTLWYDMQSERRAPRELESFLENRVHAAKTLCVPGRGGVVPLVPHARTRPRLRN